MLDVERVEKKYLINSQDMVTLKERLGAYLEVDPHNGVDGYMVRSVYFDSIRDLDYSTKADGLDKRKKIRLRLYDPSDQTVKLELKEKVNGRQRKRSIPVSRENAIQMLQGNYDFLFQMENDLAKTLYYYMTKEVYRPKCIVEYDRYAFVYEVNDTRVTFDQNLRCTLDVMRFFDPDPFWIPAGGKSRITMEVKYNRFLFSGVKNAISNHIAIETSNSKYCKAREQLKY